jgi:SAM-dependent methyltransferase
MLEFGIFQGGSPALFSLWFGVEKFVGVDICPPVVAFDRFCRTHEVGSRIRLFYGISQADRTRVEAIVHAEFGATPIDVIIDDASHAYRASRRTFEIAFPLLRPGGVYVIEDWGWAHWPQSGLYRGQTALSMLVMELLMACASRGDVISEIRAFPAFAFVRKSPEAKPMTDFRLDRLYTKRGIELVGSRNMNLGGAVRVVGEGLAGGARRALQRAKRRILRDT